LSLFFGTLERIEFSGHRAPTDENGTVPGMTVRTCDDGTQESDADLPADQDLRPVGRASRAAVFEEEYYDRLWPRHR
jgi:hypothetical protein